MQEEHVVVRVTVKWGTEKFSELPLELTSSLQKFRHLLNGLTGVPVEKQKIIFKGQTLKDDMNLTNSKIVEGSVLMMMGQAEGNTISQVTQKTVFLEDLSAQEKAKLLKEKAGIVLPIGLENMGNTCYMNASIQCMRRVNELKNYLVQKKLDNNVQVAPQSKQLFRATQMLFNQLEKRGEAFKPTEFLQYFMNIFPMFAEREQNGGFKQQDADECFQNILQTIEPVCSYETPEGRSSNLIKDLFEIEMEVRLRNGDIPEEPVSIKSELSKKLMCIIDNENKPVNTLVEGIKASLEGQLWKNSPLDNQNHLYIKEQRIKKLPSYLLVQMVRFYWKQGANGQEGTKSKILRQVSFPKILDIFEFCSEELQKNLTSGREYEKKQLIDQGKQDQDNLEQFKQKYEQKNQGVPVDTKEIFKKFKEEQKVEDIKKHDEQLYREHGMGLENGNYEVVAVLTHKGRQADSGHYVAWVHATGDRWICYDDDIVTEISLEEILALRGGGDWHMGYYLLYRKIELL